MYINEQYFLCFFDFIKFYDKTNIFLNLFTDKKKSMEKYCSCKFVFFFNNKNAFDNILSQRLLDMFKLNQTHFHF